MEPIAELLDLPEGYGQPTRTLPWESVRERLERALHYWVATTRPDGRPHVVPRDGTWLDDVWYYGGGADTVHHRNLEHNPAAVMHLADGWQAVIVEGECRLITPDLELTRRIVAASQKYAHLGYAPDPDSRDLGGPVWALHPVRALAWTAYPDDATRFRFR